MIIQEDSMLLNYEMITDPVPLRARAESHSETGSIIFNVSVPSETTIWCEHIYIYIPDSSLSEINKFNVATNTYKWQGKVDGLVKGREIGLNNDTSYIKISFYCKVEDDTKINYPLILTIEAENITRRVGDVKECHIVEGSKKVQDSKCEDKDMSFDITIYNPNYYLHNFVASKYDSTTQETVPGGNFQNGEPIKLSWEGNLEEYKVISVPGNTPIYSGKASYFILPSGLTQMTSFVLIGSRIDSVSGQIIYYYETLTVNIINPDIEPRQIKVKNSIIAEGCVSSKKISTDTLVANEINANGNIYGGKNIKIAGNLTVEAPGKIYTDNIEVKKGLQLNGASYINGKIDINNQDTHIGGILNINQEINILGKLNVVGSAEFNNDTKISGKLMPTGEVRLFNIEHQLEPNKLYVCKTDGLVIGEIRYPEGVNDFEFGYIYAATTKLKNVRASISKQVNTKTGKCYPTSNSIVMPVMAGEKFGVGSDSIGKTYVVFWWVPLGLGAPQVVSEIHTEENFFD